MSAPFQFSRRSTWLQVLMKYMQNVTDPMERIAYLHTIQRLLDAYGQGVAKPMQVLDEVASICVELALRNVGILVEELDKELIDTINKARPEEKPNYLPPHAQIHAKKCIDEILPIIKQEMYRAKAAASLMQAIYPVRPSRKRSAISPEEEETRII